MSARVSTPALRAAESAIAGMGVFARRDFAPGERIRSLSGSLQSLAEVIRRADEGDVEGSDVLGVDDSAYLVLDELDRCFNHSCDPNGAVVGAGEGVELLAIRAVRTGDEITFDYSTTMADDPEAIAAAGRSLWRCPCSCGATNCRGVIDQFVTLPIETRRRYVDRGWAPDFVLRAFAPSSRVEDRKRDEPTGVSR